MTSQMSANEECIQFNFNERAHRQAADAVWQRKNNAGAGFPVGPEEGDRSVINQIADEIGELLHEARGGDDDKAIYRDGDEIVIVAWAGGLWAVSCTAQELYDAI